MKISSTFICLIVLTPFLLNASTCDCEKELNFVTNYFEENLPGFQDNVNEQNINAYNLFKKDLLAQSKSECGNKDNCYKIIVTYVEFFKDNHANIRMSSIRVDENQNKEVEDFINSKIFKERERITNITIKENNQLNSIENVYQSKGDAYTIAIVESKTKFRDYAGVIVDSKTRLWKKGQVKLELKRVDSNSFNMFDYRRNHSINYKKNVKLENGVLHDVWFNVNLKEKVSYNTDTYKELTFKEISNEINYMYIPTFEGGWYSKIEKFYQENDSLIRSKPTLIIDVRNNGGGSDKCVKPLLKYMYTKSFYQDNIEAYATQENIRKYSELLERFSKDTTNFNKKFLRSFSELIERMKVVPNGTFVSKSDGELVELSQVLKYPLKVAIIANKNCASACETFLFLGLESEKTILVGENSGGYVGYGDVTPVNTPNFGFILNTSIIRYNKQRAYEVIGISPHYYLSNDRDWINQTIDILTNH